MAPETKEVQGRLRLPAWIANHLMPLLSGDEFKVYIYIVRRTWGSHSYQARVSFSQMAFGRQYNGDYLDGGTGLSTKTCSKHVKTLLKYKLMVRQLGQREQLQAPMYRPCPGNMVDWQGLTNRYNEQRAARLAVAAAQGHGDGEPDELRPLPDLLQILQEHSTDYIPEGFLDTVATEYNPTGLLAYNRAMEGESMARSYQVVPKHIEAARAAGMDEKASLALVNAIVRASTEAPLLDIWSDGSVYSDAALQKGQDASVPLILLGYKEPKDVDEIVESWRTGWKKGVRQEGAPNIGQIVHWASKMKVEKEAAQAVQPEAGRRIIDPKDSLEGKVVYDRVTGKMIVVPRNS